MNWRPLYEDRPGRLHPGVEAWERAKGDNAEMALIELVDYEVED